MLVVCRVFIETHVYKENNQDKTTVGEVHSKLLSGLSKRTLYNIYREGRERHA